MPHIIRAGQLTLSGPDALPLSAGLSLARRLAAIVAPPLLRWLPVVLAELPTLAPHLAAVTAEAEHNRSTGDTGRAALWALFGALPSDVADGLTAMLDDERVEAWVLDLLAHYGVSGDAPVRPTDALWAALEAALHHGLFPWPGGGTGA